MTFDTVYLHKAPLNELKKKNFMYYNSKSKSTKNELLNFSSLKQFNEYIKVYKSYLNIKEKKEKYNIKNKNSIFEVFQNLLYIAINGYGTKYEYKKIYF